MTRVGFIGRTKALYEAIKLFSQLDGFEVSFIWTCKDESYYEFKSDNFEDLAKDKVLSFFIHLELANLKVSWKQMSSFR